MKRLTAAALATMLVVATILALAGAAIHYVGNIPASSVTAVDGDTVAVQGQPKLFRIVGLDAPETGNRAKCAAERALGKKAKARLQQLVSTGSVKLRGVPCSCPPETVGTKDCNSGRTCGTLTVDDVDIAQTLIAEGLARPFVCGETSCPKRQGWC